MISAAFLGFVAGAVVALVLLYAAGEWQQRQRSFDYHWTCPRCGIQGMFSQERYMLESVGHHTLMHGVMSP